ncbi:MAG: DUF503 domain-containing protein [Deltaproteobacteria bacterium]
MVVGVCRVTIIIHDGSSLKDKRQVLKGILAKVKNRFNVSIAEVQDNDVWQKATIGFCAVGTDRAHINSTIDKVLDFIEGLHLADLLDHSIELINC